MAIFFIPHVFLFTRGQSVLNNRVCIFILEFSIVPRFDEQERFCFGPWPAKVGSIQFLPAARRSGRLDGVDPKPVGEVPERLQRLLVWFVVVFHVVPV